LQDHAYDNDLEDGYKTVIDVPSFVDFMLVNELSNSDVYQSSTFFHKDRDGKLRAGPVWDFNLSLGSTLQMATVKLINGNLTMGIESVRHFGLIYSIMKILDVIYRSDGTKSKQQQPLNKDVLIAYLIMP
jgi:spore coat protein CotH